MTVEKLRDKFVNNASKRKRKKQLRYFKLMNQELKDKIQSIIDHKERQSKHFLNVFIQQMEEIATLKRLRDF
jgi:murein tripeptide amidase MpaA